MMKWGKSGLFQDTFRYSAGMIRKIRENFIQDSRDFESGASGTQTKCVNVIDTYSG
jgi:hypothetical protein